MATLNRPDGEPIDLETLRAASPDDSFMLFTVPTQEAIRAMPTEAQHEVGTTIVGLADVVARQTPPAIRIAHS